MWKISVVSIGFEVNSDKSAAKVERELEFRFPFRIERHREI